MNVTVFSEYDSRLREADVKSVYPDGIHGVLRDILKNDYKVTCVTQDDGEDASNLTKEILDNTDVLVWWGHHHHGEVNDAVVSNVLNRLDRGMGVIILHSGHESKLMQRISGTSCSVVWREAGEKERIWLVDRNHEIFKGIDAPYIELEREETYGERFNISTPDELLGISWFSGGNVFRSAITYRRGAGKVFYFQPGHETLPSYHNDNVRKIIVNAVNWARPTVFLDTVRSYHEEEPSEK